MKKLSAKKQGVHSQSVGKPNMNAGRSVGLGLMRHKKADRSTMDVDGSHGKKQLAKHGMAC